MWKGKCYVYLYDNHLWSPQSDGMVGNFYIKVDFFFKENRLLQVKLF